MAVKTKAPAKQLPAKKAAKTAVKPSVKSKHVAKASAKPAVKHAPARTAPAKAPPAKSVAKATPKDNGKAIAKAPPLPAGKALAKVAPGARPAPKPAPAPMPTANLPYRAGKGWLFEGGIRVPFLVRMPGAAKSGVTNDTPVISPDIFATALEFAGAKLPASTIVDGRSLVPLLRGGAAPARDAR